MLKIAVCDNDKIFANYLSDIISQEQKGLCAISVYNSVSSFVKAYEANSKAKPDILFMDICLNDGDGVETVNKIRASNSAIKVIYVTGYPEHSERIFETKPTYLLLKPVDKKKLKKALQAAKEDIYADLDKFVTFKTTDANVCISHNDIKYAESNLRLVTIYTKQGELVVRQRLDEIEEMLGKSFCRTHKSFLVNMKYISLIELKGVLLFSKERIPLSKSRAKEARIQITSYIEGEK